MRSFLLDPKAFAARLLPLLLGAGAFLLFIVTLNPWVSLQSLGTVARVSGWLWRPQLEQPLNAALFYPFSFLPASWIPTALNLFTAACAAVVLSLLARSVALLPHDLTKNQPFPNQQPAAAAILSIPTAWIPPLLAALLCALQLSFWEHATSASGEIIDLLIFAYVIRSLLEFRLDQQQFWLSRAAFAFGAGMANNWAMLGFFPVFLIAILRLKGYGAFRERRFLSRMAFWGALGLSFLLLLPLLQAFAPNGQVDFWTALKAHLKSQTEFLGYLRRPRFRILLVASLLPVMVLSIRWKSHTVQFADDTRLGNFLTKGAVHLVHGLFFLISLWIALDPTFSPRNLNLGTPMLSYYYLSAMVFGYCAGYFLLFDSRHFDQQGVSAQPRIFAPSLVSVAGVSLVCLLPALLVWRNLDPLRQTNGPLLHDFARDLYADLPSGKSVVLSDDPVELLLLQAQAAGFHRDKQPILLDAPSLNADRYHIFMAARFNSRWPVTQGTGSGSPGKILKLISTFGARESLVYLQPAFGLLFEIFKGRPLGLIYVLTPRVPGEHQIRPVVAASGPVKPGDEHNDKIVSVEEIGSYQILSDDDVDHNESIWNERWTKKLRTLAKQTEARPGYGGVLGRKLLARLYLARESNGTVSFVGAAYSRRLNYWGVQMQRQGHGVAATTSYHRALDLNPENLTAHINLEYSQRSPAERALITVSAIQNAFPELFARFTNWREVLQSDGPVDEPSFLFRSGRLLLDGGNTLQAIESFARCVELAPDWTAAKLWLAQSLVQHRNFAAGLKATDQLQTSNSLKDGPSLAHLLQCRVTALKGLGRTNEAAACLTDYVSQNGAQDEVLSAAAELYAEFRQFESELPLLEELLKREPARPDLLCRKGLAQLQMSQYESAITTLTAALNIVPRNEYARLYRAVSYLGHDQLELARSDYQELLGTAENPRNALFGLGTVAWRLAQTNLAIHYYEQYLTNHVPATRQDLLASERLNELRRGK